MSTSESAPRARRKRWGAGIGLAGVARAELVALKQTLVGASPIPEDAGERFAARSPCPGCGSTEHAVCSLAGGMAHLDTDDDGPPSPAREAALDALAPVPAPPGGRRRRARQKAGERP